MLPILILCLILEIFFKEFLSSFFEDSYLPSITAAIFALLFYIFISRFLNKDLGSLNSDVKKQRLIKISKQNRFIQIILTLICIVPSVLSFMTLSKVFTGAVVKGTVVKCDRDSSHTKSFGNSVYADVEISRADYKFIVHDNLPRCNEMIGKSIGVIVSSDANVSEQRGILDRWTNKYGSICLCAILMFFIFLVEIDFRRKAEKL